MPPASWKKPILPTSRKANLKKLSRFPKSLFIDVDVTHQNSYIKSGYNQ
jgi:hypothetical protein